MDEKYLEIVLKQKFLKPFFTLSLNLFFLFFFILIRELIEEPPLEVVLKREFFNFFSL